MSKLAWRNPPGQYRDLPMRCAPGTHTAVADAICRLMPIQPGSPPPTVLDLASGSGALLARMADLDYRDAVAVELDAAKFQLPQIKPLPLDLNGDFAANFDRRFPIITAIEIIEHLNSPRHFLTQIRRLLTDDGLLILSTPNIADWLGRIRFFLTGTLRYFDDRQYQFNHHVSPLPAAQARHLFSEVGLRIVESTTVGNFAGPLKMLCFSPIWLPMRWIMGKQLIGEVILYALAKDDGFIGKPEDWTK